MYGSNRVCWTLLPPLHNVIDILSSIILQQVSLPVHSGDRHLHPCCDMTPIMEFNHSRQQYWCTACQFNMCILIRLPSMPYKVNAVVGSPWDICRPCVCSQALHSLPFGMVMCHCSCSFGLWLYRQPCSSTATAQSNPYTALHCPCGPCPW